MAGETLRPIRQTSRGAWSAVMTVAAIALASSSPVFGQPKAKLSVRSTQVYLHVPQLLELRVHDCSKLKPPVIPDVPGCKIRYDRGPLQYQSHSLSGGRSVSEIHITYQYSLTPTKVGELVIPPITVVADGEEYKTEPLRILVRKAPEVPPSSNLRDDIDDPDANRLLLAEVRSRRDKLFVGQRAELVLTIWIKPANYGGRPLPESEMLRYISGSFGPFNVNEVSSSRVPLPRPDGSTDLYYAIELPAKFIIDQEGPIDVSEVSVSAKYPVRFRRSIFGDLSVSQYQPLHVRPTVTVPDALPLPTDGRPASFSGAVGRYRISVIALPTNVRIGDPIELTITITGDPVESLRQPDLSLVPGLADNFRIADSDLAGIISGNDKRFKQTIRAKRTDVTEIPPLEFCYFDPVEERYEVARTEATPLLVRAVERLDASDLGAIASETPNTPATQLELRDGLRGLKTTESELLSQAPTITQAQVWTATLAGPAVFCAAWGVTTLVGRKRNAGSQRKRHALRNAERRIRDARAGEVSAAEFHGRIESALAGYLSDRLNQPPARFLGADASTQLRDRGVNEDLVERCAELLRKCREAAYSGDANGDASLAEHARQCIQDLERERL